MDTEKIKNLIKENRLDEARSAIGDSAGADALYLLGRIAWKEGQPTRAMSLYNEAISAGGTSEVAEEARVALEQARKIMDFYNKDLYNP